MSEGEEGVRPASNAEALGCGSLRTFEVKTKLNLSNDSTLLPFDSAVNLK